MATLKDVTLALELAIDEATSKATAEAIGEYSAEQIKKRTRVGKGVDKFAGKQEALKIKASTKRIRKGLKDAGKLSPETTPAKANLTRTGKLLDSMNYKYDAGSTTIEIGVSKRQQRKANELEEQGHKFLNLTRGEFKHVIEIMVKRIVQKLKRSL